jgi:hypothetical protein
MRQLWKLMVGLVSLLPVAAYASDEPVRFKVVKPDPGREEVKPMKPDWCSDYKPNPRYAKFDRGAIGRRLEQELGHANTFVDIGMQRTAAAIACDFPDDDRVQQQVAYARQAWVNYTGTTAEENHESLKIRMAKDSGGKAMCDSVMPPNVINSYDDATKQAFFEALGCSNNKGYLNERNTAGPVYTYWLDRPDKPASEMMRAWHVWNCLAGTTTGQLVFNGTAYAACGVDARRLDHKALDAELEQMKLNPFGRALAIEVWSRAKLVADRYAAWVEEQEQKTPGAKHALVELPEEGFTSWDKLYADHKDAFDLANAVEDKLLSHSRAEYDSLGTKTLQIGCEDLRKSWRDYVSSKGPKTIEELRSVGTDEVGYPLLDRLMLCDRVEGRMVDAQVERTFLLTRPMAFRGPRYLAVAHTFEQSLDQRDKLGPVLSVPVLQRVLSRGQLFGLMSESGIANQILHDKEHPREDKNYPHMEEAKVATAKAQKDGTVELTFKTEKWIEPDWECVTSNRFDQFAADGTPIFFKDCKVVGHHTATFNLGPRTVEAFSAEGVKPGLIVHTVSVDTDKKGTPHAAVVELFQPGKSDPTLLRYYGFTLGSAKNSGKGDAKGKGDKAKDAKSADAKGTK